MLKASLPAGINKPSERIIAINDLGREEINAAERSNTRGDILHFLAENGETPQRELEKIYGETRARRYVRELLATGAVDAFFRSSSAKVKAKVQKAVRLIDAEAAADEKPLSEAQQRIVDTVASSGEMLFVDLLEKANVGASPINTLVKRGRLEIFTAELMRDPLADARLPEIRRTHPERGTKGRAR